MKWFENFWNEHGKQISFGGVAVLFAVGFIFSGIKELSGPGVTILTGVAMLCFNEARGNKKE